MPDELSHNEAWVALRNGDREALLLLYNEYYIGLMNYGIKLTGDRDFTNDCITQILLRLWDGRKQLASVENTRAYLLTCLRRELFAEKRMASAKAILHGKMQKQAGLQEASYEEYIIQFQTDCQLRERLARSLDKLTGREKELIKLKFFEGLCYDEIAVKCGITKRTAYNIIHGAIRTLKNEFARRPAAPLNFEPSLPLLLLILGNLS